MSNEKDIPQVKSISGSERKKKIEEQVIKILDTGLVDPAYQPMLQGFITQLSYQSKTAYNSFDAECGSRCCGTDPNDLSCNWKGCSKA